MRTLYPPLEASESHCIQADDLHELYVEESGNPQGVPVVFLHGGPGSGCSAEHRRLFDPDLYRVILFDQRGSGKSLPLGETSRNTTEHLVADMEIIRRHLGIQRWMIFAGSWGATLALVYAISNRERVMGMVLRGVFLAREADLNWFFFELRRMFPQAWERFTHGIRGCDKLGDLFEWYRERVSQNDIAAARSWSEWGSCVVNWHRVQNSTESTATKKSAVNEDRLLAKTKIEIHYACNRYFLGKNEILDSAGSLAGIPVSIVHGRFDLTCTMEAAWRIYQSIPGSRFIEVADAGHLLEEPAMTSALIEESERMRKQLVD
jgi:proline iminopeptidase